MLGPQSPRALRGAHAVRALLVVVALALVLPGCATRADVLRQDRYMRAAVQEQQRQLRLVQREVERLRAAIEEGGAPARSGGGSPLVSLEGRVARLETEVGIQGAAAAATAAAASPTETPSTTDEPVVDETQTAAVEPPVAATPPAESADEWRREVAQEQAAAGAVDSAERAEYLRIMDDVASKDYGRAAAELDAFAAKNKGSRLADNATYWAARCQARRGDQDQAISKYYDVVTRYPKSDKAPAALLQQGNLFIQMGDIPDARLALSKLIRDYPASEEAKQARQQLARLER
jgi:tol-pal system protein YbgF